ncbi:hypothetical protein QQX98_000023 [Neonectria punicea]|uniref:Uncharacterized protein n=1 Tax=Neonectria punicea TaxID=979145 RepID=A0ABR1HVA0_9HYPO
MKRRVKAWIEAKQHKHESRPKGKDPDVPEPELPRLPDPRPYSLTPATSTENLAARAQTSPLFDKLPPNIRREILIIAFGNRRIHLDLALDHPLNPKDAERAARVAHGHCGPQTPHFLGVDESQARFWQWRGCACHRIPPDHYSFYHDRDREVQEPGEDACCRGTARRCDEWTENGAYPEKCWIGVMGWLLTCRQA